MCNEWMRNGIAYHKMVSNSIVFAVSKGYNFYNILIIHSVIRAEIFGTNIAT
ncbi:MAG: hypothetical protein HQK95_00565 [Nitrospirae bacterium]|nr:hypothetical protein [Nitrospirota bacterium]